MKAIKARHWIEAAVAAIALIAVFSLTIPLFFQTQEAAAVKRVERNLEALARHFMQNADLLKRPGSISLRYQIGGKGRHYAINGVVSHKSFDYIRAWIDINRLPLELREEMSLEDDAHYWLIVFDGQIGYCFVVAAWMGASELEVEAEFNNDDFCFYPVITEDGYDGIERRVPLYSAERGWDKPGVVYRDSYQMGWRETAEF